MSQDKQLHKAPKNFKTAVIMPRNNFLLEQQCCWLSQNQEGNNLATKQQEDITLVA